jgi:formate hydrogenlyase subunit 6/NADH:ubiquinone oxidoreductase subunit I
MSIAAMFGDVVRSLFSRPVTELYPFVKKPAPETLRGKLYWEPNKCTGCQLCVKDCPADALELIVLDRVNKRFVMKYHLDRCTFCSQCVQSCRFGCLDLSNTEWELAALRKEPFTMYYGKEEDIKAHLAKPARISAGIPGEG